jgi:hypothetical protein
MRRSARLAKARPISARNPDALFGFLDNLHPPVYGGGGFGGVARHVGMDPLPFQRHGQLDALGESSPAQPERGERLRAEAGNALRGWPRVAMHVDMSSVGKETSECLRSD